MTENSKTNHVEALFGVFPRSLSAHTVDSRLLAIVDGRLADALNGSRQVLVEFALDRPADVVPQVPGSDEEDIDSRDLGDLLDLSNRRQQWSSFPQYYALACFFSTYILQRLLGLDLHDRQERIIGRLQILELRNTARRAHRERASEASPSRRREFRGFDQFPGVVGGVQQGNDDAVGAAVEGPYIASPLA